MMDDGTPGRPNISPAQGWAEALCRIWLRAQGYRLIATDYRKPVGEIDLIAGRGQVLAMVEVKVRARLEDALSAVGDRQQRRIIKACGWFLSAHPQYADKIIRFDLFALAAWRLPVHIRDAWRALN